jgi:hypothetical protein
MRPSPNEIIRKIPPPISSDIVEDKGLSRCMPPRIEDQLLVANLQAQFVKEFEGLGGREPTGYISCNHPIYKWCEHRHSRQEVLHHAVISKAAT